MHGETLKLVL